MQDPSVGIARPSSRQRLVELADPDPGAAQHQGSAVRPRLATTDLVHTAHVHGDGSVEGERTVRTRARVVRARRERAPCSRSRRRPPRRAVAPPGAPIVPSARRRGAYMSRTGSTRESRRPRPPRVRTATGRRPRTRGGFVLGPRRATEAREDPWRHLLRERDSARRNNSRNRSGGRPSGSFARPNRSGAGCPVPGRRCRESRPPTHVWRAAGVQRRRGTSGASTAWRGSAARV